MPDKDPKQQNAGLPSYGSLLDLAQQSGKSIQLPQEAFKLSPEQEQSVSSAPNKQALGDFLSGENQARAQKNLAIQKKEYEQRKIEQEQRADNALMQKITGDIKAKFPQAPDEMITRLATKKLGQVKQRAHDRHEAALIQKTNSIGDEAFKAMVDYNGAKNKIDPFARGLYKPTQQQGAFSGKLKTDFLEKDGKLNPTIKRQTIELAGGVNASPERMRDAFQAIVEDKVDDFLSTPSEYSQAVQALYYAAHHDKTPGSYKATLAGMRGLRGTLDFLAGIAVPTLNALGKDNATVGDVTQFTRKLLPDPTIKGPNYLSERKLKDDPWAYLDAALNEVVGTAAEFAAPAIIMRGLGINPGSRFFSNLTKAGQKAVTNVAARGLGSSANKLATLASKTLNKLDGSLAIKYLDNVVSAAKTAAPQIYASYYDQAIQLGYAPEEAADWAKKRAGINILTESIYGPFQDRGLGKKALIRGLQTESRAIPSLSKSLLEKGKDLGEAAIFGTLEEFSGSIADAVQDFRDQKKRGEIPEDAKFDWEGMWTGAAEEGFVGGLAEAMMRLVGGHGRPLHRIQETSILQALEDESGFKKALQSQVRAGNITPGKAGELLGFINAIKPQVEAGKNKKLSEPAALRYGIERARLEEATNRFHQEQQSESPNVDRLMDLGERIKASRKALEKIENGTDLGMRVVSGREMAAIATRTTPTEIAPEQAAEIEINAPYRGEDTSLDTYRNDPEIAELVAVIGNPDVATEYQEQMMELRAQAAEIENAYRERVDPNTGITLVPPKQMTPQDAQRLSELQKQMIELAEAHPVLNRHEGAIGFQSQGGVPVIIGENGKVIDGKKRIAEAIAAGEQTISAVRSITNEEANEAINTATEEIFGQSEPDFEGLNENEVHLLGRAVEAFSNHEMAHNGYEAAAELLLNEGVPPAEVNNYLKRIQGETMPEAMLEQVVNRTVKKGAEQNTETHTNTSTNTSTEERKKIEQERDSALEKLGGEPLFPIDAEPTPEQQKAINEWRDKKSEIESKHNAELEALENKTENKPTLEQKENGKTKETTSERSAVSSEDGKSKDTAIEDDSGGPKKKKRTKSEDQRRAERQRRIDRQKALAREVFDPLGVVLQYFIAGGKIATSDFYNLFDITPKDAKPRPGQRTNAEQRRKGIWAYRNGAPTIRGLAESLWTEDITGRYDDSDYVNAIEEALTGFENPSHMVEYMNEAYKTHDELLDEESLAYEQEVKEELDAIAEMFADEQVLDMLEADEQIRDAFYNSPEFEALLKADKEANMSEQDLLEEMPDEYKDRFIEAMVNDDLDAANNILIEAFNQAQEETDAEVEAQRNKIENLKKERRAEKNKLLKRQSDEAQGEGLDASNETIRRRLSELDRNIEAQEKALEKLTKEKQREKEAKDAQEKSANLFTPEEKKTQKTRKPRVTEQLSKEAKKELDEAWDDLNNLLNEGVSTSPEAELKKHMAATKVIGMAAKYGIYKFADIVALGIEKLGNAADALFPYIKKAYLSYQADVTDDILEQMDSVSDVRNFDYQKFKDNVLDTTGDSQPDSGDTANPTSENAETVSGERGGSRPDGEQMEKGDSQRIGATNRPGHGSLFAPTSGAGSHNESYKPIGGLQPETDNAGAIDGRGDGIVGTTRVQPDGSRSEKVNPATSQRAGSFAEREKLKAAEQVKVEGAKYKERDADNIRQTLPYLLPEQQRDVQKAEDRYFDPAQKTKEKANGKGMLFTNGTGTGKTFTALGVIKRFAMRGKKNVLIVVPSQEKVSDWQRDGRKLLLDIAPLESTTDGGKPMAVTTYANFRANEELLKRDFDLVVYDESHRLMESKTGETSSTTLTHYLIGNKDEQAALQRLTQVHPLWKEAKKLQEDLREAAKERDERLEKNIEQKLDRIKEKQRELLPGLKERAKAAAENTKVLFLSATPFKAHFNLRYANGFLFDWGNQESRQGHSRVDAESQFMLDNFGSAYEWKYHRLQTKSDSNPEAVAMQEVQFAEKLMRDGSMSGRTINSEMDYSREFPLVSGFNSTLFNKAFNDIFNYSEGRFSRLRDTAAKVFHNYNYSTQLFESLKTAMSIDRIKAHLNLGRKVVVFHRRQQASVTPPFATILNQVRLEAQTTIQNPDASAKDKEAAAEAINQVDLFEEQYGELLDYEQTLNYASAVEQISEAFPDKAVFFNGRVDKKTKSQAIRDFNTDGSGKNILVVQEEAGKEGISLHDVTGKHQRALISLSMPNSTITALQVEGRIYRIGQESDAIFEYPLLGLDLETAYFGQNLNRRLSTTENLAVGSQSRDLTRSFAEGVLFNSTTDLPNNKQGKGGKEFDAKSEENQTPFQKAKLIYATNQKVRGKRDQRAGVDYFATPEPLGQKMVEWAGLKPGEHALEPSAGHGAIAMWMPATVATTAIEPSFELYSKLTGRAQGASKKVLNQKFEDHNIINKYGGIVMNPPFGSGGKTAMEHIEKAFKHLRDGGRIVALIPKGASMDKRIDAFLNTSDAHLRASFDLPTSTFQQSGTSVSTRIVIIDKISEPDGNIESSSKDFSYAETINDLFNAIEHVSAPERVAAKVEAEAESEGAKTEPPLLKPVEEHKNTRTGEIQYKVIPATYLGDDYSRINEIAKKHGGFYSRFVKGFLFNKEIDAKKFHESVEPVKGNKIADLQVSSKNFKRITPKAFNRLLDRLKKAFPTYAKKGAIITTQQELESALERNGLSLEDFMDKVQLMRTRDEQVYGAILPDGTMYLDAENMNANTPIHEFGHVWQRLLPDHFAKGVKLMQESKEGRKLFNQIKENSAYGHLTDQQIWEEALVTAIGNKGESVFTGGKLREFTEWLKRMWANLSARLGFEVNADTKFNTFVSKAVSDILNSQNEKQENEKSEKIPGGEDSGNDNRSGSGKVQREDNSGNDKHTGDERDEFIKLMQSLGYSREAALKTWEGRSVAPKRSDSGQARTKRAYEQIAGLSPAPRSATGRIPVAPIIGGRPKQLSEIIFNASKGLKQRIFYGRPRGQRGSLGSYAPGNTALTIRYNNDLDTTAHELGHSMDDLFNIMDSPGAAIESELMPYAVHGSPAPKGHPNPRAYELAEGFAEFVRAVIVNPEEAKRQFPNTYALYETKIPEGYRSALNQFGIDIRTFMGATNIDKIKANIQLTPKRKPSLVDILLSRDRNGNEFYVHWTHRVASNYTNPFKVFELADKYLRKVRDIGDPMPANDPILLARLFAGVDGKVTEILTSGMIDSEGNPLLADGTVVTYGKDGEIVKDGERMNLKWLFWAFDNSDEATVRQEREDTIAYMIAERTVELGERFGREDVLTGIGGGLIKDMDVAKAALQEFNSWDNEKKARIKESAERYRKMADSVLKYMVAKGRLSQEQYLKIKADNTQYVALQRIAEAEPGEEIQVYRKKGGKGIGSQTEVLHSVKGSSKTIQDPYTSLFDTLYKGVKESDRNEVMLAFRELLVSNRGMNQGLPERIADIAKQGKQGDPNSITIWVDGKPEYWVFQSDLYRSLKGMEGINSLLKVLTALPRLLRWSVIHAPTFALRNIIRDTQDRLIKSYNNTPENWFGLKSFTGSKEHWGEVARMGGLNAGYYMRDHDSYYGMMSEAMRQVAQKKNTLLLSRGGIEKVWGRYEKILSYSETINRVAEYRSAFQEAKSEGMDNYNARLYAAFHSRDLLDFALMGHHMRIVNQLIPFSNAAVQGIRSSAVRMKKDPMGFAFRVMLFSMVPSLIEWLLTRGDDEDKEEYEAMPDYQKDMFYNFKVGDNTWIAIPKPYELSLFGAGMNRALSKANGNENAFDGYAGSVAKSMLPIDEGDISGPLRTIVEATVNYDFFREKAIVPYYENGLDLALRNTQSASRIGQAVQAVAGIDARKADHVIKGMTSYYGNYGLKLSNIGREDGEKFNLSDLGFFKQTPAYNSKPVQEYMKLATEFGLTGKRDYREFSKLVREYFEATDNKEKAEKARLLRNYAEFHLEVLEKHKDKKLLKKLKDANR